jgi:VPDSG-CTERM motif
LDDHAGNAINEGPVNSWHELCFLFLSQKAAMKINLIPSKKLALVFGPGVPGVPDGGTTVMLLGAALGALGMARRFLN